MRVRAQRLGRVVDPGELGLAERCVDFLVADLVQQDRLAPFPPLSFGIR